MHQNPQYGQPMLQQPGAGNWMAAPQGQGEGQVPPGLEYLTQVDQLLVKQQVEMLEAFVGFETNNKYQILNSMGQRVYFAAEDTDCCTRNCCGPSRAFDIKIMDNQRREVIHIKRPLRCRSCFWPCCLQEMDIESPPGVLIGKVKQEWSICEPKYAVCDADGRAVLYIKGPICTWSCCGDVEFEVFGGDGSTAVGMISKQFTGLVKEAFTDADNFGVTFPLDLDVKVKATLLGAVFLIDFMFFEEGTKDRNDAPGMLD